VVPPQDLASRPRRNRRSATVREAFRETILTPSNFIYPIFVHDGEEDIPIASMPGQSRLGWKTGMIDKVREARAAGVNQVVVFPKTPDNLKTETAEECFNPDGLAQRSISLLKDTFPDLEVYTDVALDMNDETVYYLCKQAVSQARAGADVISPSDMMDGRVGAIREALDAEGFTNVAIMSYTAKCVTRPTPPLAFLRREISRLLLLVSSVVPSDPCSSRAD
jgi:porphobilinogen synthase